MPVEVLTDVASVILGGTNTCAVNTTQILYCWGSNGYGQIGNGTIINPIVPVEILTGVQSVSLRSASTCAIKNDGTLYCW